MEKKKGIIGEFGSNILEKTFADGVSGKVIDALVDSDNVKAGVFLGGIAAMLLSGGFGLDKTLDASIVSTIGLGADFVLAKGRGTKLVAGSAAYALEIATRISALPVRLLAKLYTAVKEDSTAELKVLVPAVLGAIRNGKSIDFEKAPSLN